MSDERRMHNAPDVKHPPRGAGLAIRPHCMGCDEWKSPLGFRGVGVRARCADCLAAKAARGVTA